MTIIDWELGKGYLETIEKLEERLEKLERSSGVAVSEDELRERRRKLEREFGQGGGI